MFDKIKSRKAPLSLSSVSNAIKTLGTSDLSPKDFQPKLLDLFTSFQLGLPTHSIVAIAHDPVQSLLAVSTTKNEIRVYGQGSVEVVFEFKQSASLMTHLCFVKGIYLVAVLLSIGAITVISLHLKQILGTFLAPGGAITSLTLDPSLDWLVLGLSNGSLLFYDVDRLALTPFRIDNLQKRILPKQKLSPVLNVEWHPRDIGTLLISYSHLAIVYSMVTGEIQSAMVRQLNKGDPGYERAQWVANGGKKKLFGSSNQIVLEMTTAHFHPNGLHVVTAHLDGVLKFWDVQGAVPLYEKNVQIINNESFDPIQFDICPIHSIKWICSQDPELTQLVYTIGASTLEIINFGLTLKYSLTSHEKQSQFYSNPQNGRQTIEVPMNASNEPEYIVRIVPLAADNLPYFNGGWNPSNLICLTNLGSIVVVNPHNPSANLPTLPPSMGLIHPPVTASVVQPARKIDWYSVCLSRSNYASNIDRSVLLRGGAPVDNPKAPKPLGYDDTLRNILITGHESGIVRLLDVTRGEHQDPENMLEVNVKNVLGKAVSRKLAKITHVSCAFESKELLVGMANGQVVICKYGKARGGGGGGYGSSSSGNPSDFSDCQTLHQNGDASLLSIQHRVAPSSSSSFIPTALLKLENSNDSISCLKVNDTGFAAIAYTSGRIVVCDITRGPAVIFNAESLSKFLPSVSGVCYATTLEFSIVEYGQDGYSSIVLMVGTCSGGNLLMFRIVPQPNGAFECVFGDKTIGLNYRSSNGDQDPTKSKLDQIIPVTAKDGVSAVADLGMFHKLALGVVIPAYVITTSERDIRVLKVPKTKLSHKVIDDLVLRTGVVRFRQGGVFLAVLVKTGFIKFLTLPALNEISDFKLPKDIYVSIRSALESGVASDSAVLPSGELFIRTSSSEFQVLTAYIEDHRLRRKHEPLSDLLFNDTAVIPLRPSAGLLQWVKGQTKYVSVQDLTYLIAGPNRKPAKHPESQMAYNISPEANPNQGYGNLYGGAGAGGSGENDRGYKEPTKKSSAVAGAGGYNFGTKGFMKSLQGGIEQVEESLNGYANTVSETMTESVEGTKKSMYGAAFKSKFGF